MYGFKKIFNFYQKQQLHAEKKPSCTPFERSEKQCVVRHAQ